MKSENKKRAEESYIELYDKIDKRLEMHLVIRNRSISIDDASH